MKKTLWMKHFLLAAIFLSFFLDSVKILGEELQFQVSYGSVFKISADNLDEIDAFEKKPNVYITVGQLGTKKKKIAVSKFNPGTSIECEFRGRISAGEYRLFVKPKAKGQKLDPVSVTDDFQVKNPTISALSSHPLGSGDTLEN